MAGSQRAGFFFLFFPRDLELDRGFGLRVGVARVEVQMLVGKASKDVFINSDSTAALARQTLPKHS